MTEEIPQKNHSILIRDIQHGDIPLILDLIKKLSDYEKLSHEVMATEELLEEALFGKNSVPRAIVAFLDGIPAGFALYFFNFSTFVAKKGLYLEDLFVIPKARGFGVGKELFIKLAKIAKANDCGRFEWSVLDWNEPAIGFYEKMGATPMNDWTTFRLTQDKFDKIIQGRTPIND